MQSRIVRSTRVSQFLSLIFFGAGCANVADVESTASPDPSTPTEETATPLVVATPTTCVDDACFEQTVIASGIDWIEQNVSGYAVDDGGDYYNANVFILKNSTGIQASPLPADIKADLEYDALTDDHVYSVSSEIVAEIQLSEQLGYLTPTLAAIAEVDDPVVVPPEQMIKQGTSPSQFFWGRCGSQYPTYTKSININTPINNTRVIGDGFTGTVTTSGNIQASASVIVKLERKRHKVLGFCIPYAVRLVEARAQGNSTLSPAVSMTGTLSYKNAWKWDVANFNLGSIDFMVGILPVHIPINMPIKAGLTVDANVTGVVAYNASQTAVGSFDYSCNLNGCSGSSSYSLSGALAPTYSASVSARVQPTIWADAALRASLYTDALAYAQIGVRPFAYGDFWAYHGTTCGDANVDGANEVVNAQTFDLDWQVFLTAETSLLGTVKKWDNLNHSVRRHVGFWDLIGGGGSNALDPMLVGATSSLPNHDQTYGLKMRPCWPYTDPVNYSLNWGNGTITTSAGLGTTPTAITRKWSNTGTYPMTLTAVNDSHGRPINHVASHNVQVNSGSGSWTGWLDRDDPAGIGDEETIAGFQGSGQACANPLAIECQTTSGTHWALAGESMVCNTTTGGLCKNQGQSDGACMDYRVRYFCN